MFQPADLHHGTPGESQRDAGTPGVHVATVSTHLDTRTISLLLDGIESALVEAGASRIWIGQSRPALSVMADLPDTER